MIVKRFVAIATTAAAVSLLATMPAQAAPGGQSEYGQHVRMCAQMMGFDGQMNPGVHHQGRSGWDPAHSCMME